MTRITSLCRTGIFASAALAAACAEPQDTVFRSMYGSQVYALDGGRFEVVPEIGSYGGAFWCGAGEYARRALGAGWTSRVYVSRGMGEGVAVDRKSTVIFTLSPVASAAPPPVILRENRFRPGDSMSVQDAESRCSARSTR